MNNLSSPLRIAAAATFLHLWAVLAAHSDTVIDYHPGGGANSLTNPYAALGMPGPMVGEGSGYDAIYSPFNPPYETHQLVQIGEGGSLTLRLDSVVAVTAGAPELGLFTNVGLIDGKFPDGLNNVGAFGADTVRVDVSEDGLEWAELGEISCDFPGNAFTDAPGPFHPDPAGLTAADFSKPHGLQLSDLDGETFAAIVAMLDGSGGGTWIDLDASGLTAVAYIRLRVPDDGDPGTQNSFELASVTINRALAGGAPPSPISFAETFVDNPIGTRADSDAGHASYADGALTVNYDLGTSVKRTTWPLGAHLTDRQSFSYRVEFTIGSIAFGPSSFGQLSFGLVNSATTGDRRTSSPSDCWDLLTVDYFPHEDFTTLSPTVIGSREAGDSDAFTKLGFPTGSASLINEPGEVGMLPTGSRLAASLGYDATTRLLTLRLEGHPINAFGPDPDGDDTTIQYTIPGRISFEVDTFGLLCWEEVGGGTASLTFHHLSLTTPSPPANYFSWADANIDDPLARSPYLDANSDGLGNLLDYALGGIPPNSSLGTDGLSLTWQTLPSRSDVRIAPRSSTDLKGWFDAQDSIIGAGPGTELHRSTIPLKEAQAYLRLEATRP